MALAVSPSHCVAERAHHVMTDNLNTILVMSNGTALIGFVGLALFILRGQRVSAAAIQVQHQALFATAVASALWACLVFLYGQSGNPFFYRAASIMDVLRYGGWYFSMLSVLQIKAIRPVRRNRDVSIIAMVALAVTVAGVWLNYQFPADIDTGWQVPKSTLLQALLMPAMALFLLEQLIRNVEEDSRWNLKPLGIGLAGACFFDLYYYADALMYGQIDVQILSVRGLVHALVIPLYALSVARSRDWTRRIKVSNKIVIHTTLLLVVGGYLLLLAGMGYLVRLVGGDWGQALQLTVLFAALVLLLVLVFSGAMRARIRVWVGKHFFRYRYDYREEWLKFTRALSEHTTPEGLAEQIIRELADMVESPAGSLWIRDLSARNYRQFAVWNMARIDIREAREASLCRFLGERKWVINLDEMKQNGTLYEGLCLPEWLPAQKDAWLIVPLGVGNELIGFLILARARARLDVNWEVNDLLKTAGSQAAGHLAQLLALEALLETKKFETFNRMSAFVVHDLKNIVAQLSLMLNNAARHRDNPEFQQDMLATVEHALSRMRRLMGQLQEEGVRQTVLLGVDLRALFGRIQAVKRKFGREIDLKVHDEVVVQGDAERLERVFGHLIQNALDATEQNKGKVEVKVSAADGKASVEVIDTGCGMTEEFMREQLFKPFQTTKSTGMGIGVYESQQYFHELGGELTARSVLNAGTTMTVRLPLGRTSAPG